MPSILITGVSKGIGKAIGERFAQEGFAVVGCASTAASVEAVRKEHPDWRVEPVNVADKLALINFAERVLAEMGTPEVVVNNAGRFVPGAIHEEADDVFEELMATNLASAYYLSKAVVPGMKARGSGTLINIVSTAGITAYPNGGTYSITKFGMLGLSRGLREELKPHGVRVVSILPGATLTASWEGVDLPPERFMAPQDIAEAAWLAHALPPTTVLEEIVLRPQLGDIG